MDLYLETNCSSIEVQIRKVLVPVAAMPWIFSCTIDCATNSKLDYVLNQCLTLVSWLALGLRQLQFLSSTINKNILETIYNDCYLQMCIDLLGTFHSGFIEVSIF